MNAPAVSGFPTIVLRPLADRRHAWAAVLLEAPFERGALCRLFGELGLYEASGQLPCVLRLADPALCPGDAAELLPAEQIHLCLPASVCANPAREAELQRLRELGFALLAEGLPPAGAALPAAVGGLALAAATPPPADRPGPHLALGVESSADFVRGRELGFHWFAGGYALHPDAGAAPAATTHQALLLRLLTLVAADADARELEELFKQDAHLSYQLLRLVNSVAFARATKIASFGQAIALLGRRQLQRWLQLLMYAHAPGADLNPLMAWAAFRAELMEILCAARGGDPLRRDEAFMVGMFSLLDLLLHLPRERILAPLNLADEVVAALLRREGSLGELLRLVEAAESGPAEALPPLLADAGIDAEAWARSQVRALGWALEIVRGCR